ncbi:hypothetical protein SAMN05216489_08364 [Streptomyces sp. 3213]|nr:hypothetical protein SAMN05216489_08364 [Streptomyces sp. 3213] [Streptomyces sp. 3213.3]
MKTVPVPALHAFAALREVVERGGEMADLVVGRHRHPLVFLHRTPGRLGRRAQRPHQPRADHDRDGHGDQQHQTRDPGETAVG